MLKYSSGGEMAVDVRSEEGSVFVGWQSESGGPLSGIHYARPGDVVYAVFELK